LNNIIGVYNPGVFWGVCRFQYDWSGAMNGAPKKLRDLFVNTFHDTRHVVMESLPGSLAWIVSNEFSTRDEAEQYMEMLLATEASGGGIGTMNETEIARRDLAAYLIEGASFRYRQSYSLKKGLSTDDKSNDKSNKHAFHGHPFASDDEARRWLVKQGHKPNLTSRGS
jgi:hypothetical protein